MKTYFKAKEKSIQISQFAYEQKAQKCDWTSIRNKW